MPDIVLSLAPTWQIPKITLTSNDQAGAPAIVLVNNDGATVDVALQALLRGPTGDQGEPGVQGAQGPPDLGNQDYSATISGGVITENFNGQVVTTTIAAGTITAVFAAPINETWATVINAGTITTSRTA